MGWEGGEEQRNHLDRKHTQVKMKAQRSKLLRGRQKNDSAGSSVTVMLSTSRKVKCFDLNQQINSEVIAKI